LAVDDIIGMAHMQVNIAIPLLVALRGDVDAANRCIDKQLHCFHRIATQPTQSNMLQLAMVDAALYQPPAYLMLRRKADLASWLEAFGLTWSAADAWLDVYV
jgi:hypothetical protein